MYYNGVCFITLLSGLDEKETRSRTVTDMLLLSRPVMSSSLQPHGPQHARPPRPSPSPEVCPGSCPLHWRRHPAVSSSHALLSFYPQSFPSSESFPMSQVFISGEQNIGASASASVLPVNIQGWFPLRVTGLISLLSKELFKSLLQHHSSKASILQCSTFFTVQL